MNWELLNKAPPWLVILALATVSGGGSVGILSSLQPDTEIKNTLEKIDTTLRRVNTTLNNYNWRLNNAESRLNGMSVKNREQDEELRELYGRVTRLDAMTGKF